MAWTTPGTVVAGEVLTAAFWNTQVRDQFSSLIPFSTLTWQTWVPQIDQGVTTNIATSAKTGQYFRVGNIVVASFSAVISGTGTAGTSFNVTLPLAASGNTRIGIVHIFDSSASTRYTGVAELSTGKVTWVGDWSGNTGWGAIPNLALGNADQIDFMVVYNSIV